MTKFQIGHGDVHWNIADSSLLCGAFCGKDNFTSPTNTFWKATEIITMSTIVLGEFSCNTGWRGVLDKPRNLGKSIKTRRLARALRELKVHICFDELFRALACFLTATAKNKQTSESINLKYFFKYSCEGTFLPQVINFYFLCNIKPWCCVSKGLFKWGELARSAGLAHLGEMSFIPLSHGIFISLHSKSLLCCWKEILMM